MIIVLFLTANSCRKDDSQITANKNLSSENFLSEAQSYFKTDIENQNNSIELLGNNNRDKLKQLKKIVLWDGAVYQKLSSGNQSIRVPILFDTDYFTKIGEKQREYSLYGMSYLFMHKSKNNNMQAEWVIKVPDEYYIKHEDEKPKFSGIINIFDWYGNFKIGYKITNDHQYFSSKSLSIINNRQNISTQAIKTNGAGAGLSCTTTDYYVCVGTAENLKKYGCNWNYSIEICNYASVEPNYDGGGTTIEDYGSTVAIGTKAIIPKSFYSQLDSIMNSNSTLNNQQIMTLNSVLISLVSDCANNYIYHNLKSHAKITFKVDVNSTIPASYNPSTNTLTFNSNSNINYDNLQEELFHTYQNYQYSGGTSQYTGQQSGSANIEFEAKLFKDINCAIRSGSCANAFINAEYIEWLARITNNYTSYPSSINTNDFNSFIGLWLFNSGYSNNTISPNLTPIALNNLLNSNPCN